MEKIQVFIITYNRPVQVLKSIESVLNQTYQNIELIVSDNSTNFETKNVLEKKNYPNLIYIKRKIVYDPIEHLNCVLKEVTAKYFMIFHDDDTMFVNMVESLVGEIKKNSFAIAVCASAFLNKNGRSVKNNPYNKIKNNLIISSKEMVVDQYFKKSSLAPFPSYLYKKEVAENLQFEYDHGGNHCDMAFIMDITNFGSIYWLDKPLMTYFNHQGQGTKTHLFKDKIKLINYITNVTTYNKRDRIILKYRISNVYGELKNSINNRSLIIGSKRFLILLKILLKYSPFNLFPKAIIIALLKKTPYYK